MQVANVEWIPAVSILGAGLLGGGALAWFSARRRAAAGNAASVAANEEVESAGITVRELNARRDSLVAQLRDLEDTASKESAGELARRRYEVELELAGTLMEIDGASEVLAEATAAAPTVVPHQARGFVWGLGTAVVMGLIAFLALQSSAPKDQAQQQMPPASEAMAQPVASAEMQALQARIASNPEDLDARVTLARAALGANNMMEAFTQTKYVLERNPEHAPALSYQALVRLAMGQRDLSIEMLEKATKLAPNFIDGWVNTAIVYANLGDGVQTQNAIAKAIEVDPSHKAELQGLLVELQQQVEQVKASGLDPALAAGDDPHAKLGNQPAAAAAGGQAKTPVGPVISGVLTLDPSVQAKVRTPAVVFLIARQEGVQGGPPVAVRRMDVTAFPVNFTLSSADSMMGSALPAKVRLEARVDADGDVVTRSGDPTGVADGLAPGTSNANIVIR